MWEWPAFVTPFLLPISFLWDLWAYIRLQLRCTLYHIISFSGRQFKITFMASKIDRYIFPSDSSVVCQIMDMRQGWLRYRNRWGQGRLSSILQFLSIEGASLEDQGQGGQDVHSKTKLDVH